jgi:hypothetical protein
MSQPRSQRPSQVEPPWQGPFPTRATYDVNSQHGHVISNVGGDQYNSYVVQRQNFLSDVASTKTKARFLAWFGFLLCVAGGGVYGAVILRFIERVPGFGADTSPSDIQLLGPDVLGVPVGVIGFAAAGIGAVMFMVGVVLHIVASSRRRQVERTMPLYPPRMSY